MVDKIIRVNDYTAMSNDNHIPHPLWTVRLNFQQVLTGSLSEKLSGALEDLAVSVFLHNSESADGNNWTVSLTTLGKPDTDEIFRRVETVAKGRLAKKDIVAEKLPEKDWLQHVHDNFPPIHIGRFFVFGSHYTGETPGGSIPLRIDAATAFGSGEHETTRGCIQALEILKKDHVYKNGLDMGCGSGILAIAMTKLWPDMRVTAIDIDPESITVTNRHAAMNGCEKKIAAASGDDYSVPLVTKSAPFDLVTANILADPLMNMAPALARALKPGGFAVLSGLLRRQKDGVVSAHEKQGFCLAHTEEIGDWQALTLQKKMQ